MNKVKHATVRPTRSLNLLSHQEITALSNSSKETFQLFRECALAVLNTGNEEDDPEKLMATYSDFSIKVIPESRGIKLEIENAPSTAFVNGEMIRGIKEHLFSALRDLIYSHYELEKLSPNEDKSEDITDGVFRTLRNAGIVKHEDRPNLVVCWGGHSIKREEYDYTKIVGYHLGIRGLNIATGCGIGAMKGPMKGAAVAHGKQKIKDGRYVGITEPGIIASESPNPTVSELVILPDIEKRLEAFVRLAHAIIVFPGGAGTAEEVLYLLGLLMQPENQNIPLPVIFAASEEYRGYFQVLDKFIVNALGEGAREHYEIVIGQPDQVAEKIRLGIEDVKQYRYETGESYAFNWSLKIPFDMQQPFMPTHDNMAQLQLNKQIDRHTLAAELRRAFSGIVAGNIKPDGLAEIAKHGPYQLKGDPAIMGDLDQLLKDFVDQGRMKLSGDYTPCYELIK